MQNPLVLIGHADWRHWSVVSVVLIFVCVAVVMQPESAQDETDYYYSERAIANLDAQELSLLHELAEANHATAMYVLGEYYLSADGANATAIQWFKYAAQQGHREAIRKLALVPYLSDSQQVSRVNAYMYTKLGKYLNDIVEISWLRRQTESPVYEIDITAEDFHHAVFEATRRLPILNERWRIFCSRYPADLYCVRSHYERDADVLGNFVTSSAF